MQKYSIQIKRYKALQNMTVQQLSKKSGLAPATIALLLSGKNSNATINSLERIAKALGVTVHDIICL